MDINEIARRAGVSRATVSRYLNNGYVSQEKRKLIAAIIQETGYVPSQTAQQLRTGKTNLVSIIIPKVYSHSVSRVLTGITEVFSGTPYRILLSNTNNNPSEEVRCMRALAERPRVDGVILLATVITDEHRKAFDALTAPLVVMGQQLDGLNCVFHDDYRAAYEVSKLALQTSRHPGYIGVLKEDVAVGYKRHKGFLDACNELGVEALPEAQVMGDFSVESGYLCCEQIMEEAPGTDVIICATDSIAFGALACLREYGHRVPEDVQVAGIGDSEMARVVVPSLTSAHLFYKTSGHEAAKMLLDAMEKGDEIPRQLRMGCEVYARCSTR